MWQQNTVGDGSVVAGGEGRNGGIWELGHYRPMIKESVEWHRNMSSHERFKDDQVFMVRIFRYDWTSRQQFNTTSIERELLLRPYSVQDDYTLNIISITNLSLPLVSQLAEVVPGSPQKIRQFHVQKVSRNLEHEHCGQVSLVDSFCNIFFYGLSYSDIFL